VRGDRQGHKGGGVSSCCMHCDDDAAFARA
jgi:hypothetical protein